MEENEDISWKKSKTLTSGKLGRIVPIPVKTSDAIIEGKPRFIDESKEKEVIDVVKRRIESALFRKSRGE